LALIVADYTIGTFRFTGRLGEREDCFDIGDFQCWMPIGQGGDHESDLDLINLCPLVDVVLIPASALADGIIIPDPHRALIVHCLPVRNHFRVRSPLR